MKPGHYREREKNVGYYALDYNHQYHPRFSMPPLRQVQSKSGPEKAFGIALREIREAAGMSQMDVWYTSALESIIRTSVPQNPVFKVPPLE